MVIVYFSIGQKESLLKVKIHQLEIETTIGVFDWEKTIKQKLYLDLELEINASRAIKADELKYTVDYDGLSLLIREKALKNNRNLIETFADDVANWVFDFSLNVKNCKIEVFKPRAVKEARTVSFEMEKKRPSID